VELKRISIEHITSVMQGAPAMKGLACCGRNHPEGGEPSPVTFVKNERYQANNLLERADPCR